MFDGITTAQEAVDLLADAVKDKGADYVYPFEYFENEYGDSVRKACMYANRTEDGDLEPMCIVGYAASKTGDLEELHYGHEGVNIGTALGKERRSGPVAQVLVAAQTTQDEGHSWGEALENAREVAKRYV